MLSLEIEKGNLVHLVHEFSPQDNSQIVIGCKGGISVLLFSSKYYEPPLASCYPSERNHPSHLRSGLEM